MNVCFEARSQNVTYFHVALETFLGDYNEYCLGKYFIPAYYGCYFFFSFLLVILAMSFPLVPLSTG